jgi:hypothetical protein
MYVQLQAATINIQVISLVKGGLDLLDSADTVYVHIPDSLPGLRDTVRVLGRGRNANLNWALDGSASPRNPLDWDLEAVIRKVPIAAARLGVFAETRRTNGLGGPVYLPVWLTMDSTPPAAAPSSTREPIELVVRVPAAGAIKYRLLGGDWSERELGPVNGDGYFRIMLQPTTLGRVDVELRWRSSASFEFKSAPESLSIFFW